MMSSLVLMWTLLSGADADPPPPVAMVLTTRGGVTMQRDKARQPLRVMSLLRPGDVLQSGEGEAVVVFLENGRRERLKPGKEAAVEARGCTPETAIERQDKVKLSPQQLESLRELARSGRGAVGVLRGDPPAMPQRITPIYGTTLLTDKPTLSWPPTNKADSYQVQLLSAKGDRILWRRIATQARLAYPEMQPVLKGGTAYRWRVWAVQGDDINLGLVVDSKFSVATKAAQEELAGLKPLTESREAAEWLLAATVYEAHGAHDEALGLYEKLAEKLPEEANVQVALASYYERAGRADKAKEAREKARKLGVVLPEKGE